MAKITVIKVQTPAQREQAISIIRQVFLREKQWIKSAEEQFPETWLDSRQISWFLAVNRGKPAGVLRLLYDPPMTLPEHYRYTLNEGVNIESLAQSGRFVEVGRFMILPEYRRQFMTALRLIKAALREVVQRDYSHFITDVYENEINSPYNFHTRILGFETIGKHLYGELDCNCTRIILTLDILKAYKRLKENQNRIYSLLTSGIRRILNKKLLALEKR